MFSSASSEWETPWDFFDKLDRIFHFTLDPCATPENTKVPLHYFTKEDDGLTKGWDGEVVFMNPPYGRQIGKWIEKAYKEGEKIDTIVVCLIPARTDTSWWHNYCTRAREIWFLRGRIKFINRTFPSYREDGDFKLSSAPFPSAIVIFGKDLYSKHSVYEMHYGFLWNNRHLEPRPQTLYVNF